MDLISHRKDCIPIMTGWLYIPRPAQDLCIWLLTKCHLMLAIKFGNVCWQLWETFSGRNVLILLNCKALSSNCVVYNCSKPIDMVRFFFLVSLGVNVYPWEIVGMDFVIDLT